MRRSALVAIVLGVLCVADLPAQSGGRDLPRGFRTLAGVTLNRDSAATIHARLGTTREQRIGMGHDGYDSWCYVPAEASSRALLELMSDASDMGTPGRALNVIRIRADAPPAERRGCAPLRAMVSSRRQPGCAWGSTERRSRGSSAGRRARRRIR